MSKTKQKQKQTPGEWIPFVLQKEFTDTQSVNPESFFDALFPFAKAHPIVSSYRNYTWEKVMVQDLMFENFFSFTFSFEIEFWLWILGCMKFEAEKFPFP